ncbi:MAG: class I SAM-dependent methyltransferase [Clostridia bacterium]|nr:class I SAM-dependent methyltransferase [Clostridia bacterium]
MEEKEYYEQIKDWNFDEFQIETEEFTNWDMFEILKSVTNENSRILDLGTGGGEKVIKYFPEYAKEIIATDFSKAMVETAKENLKKSGRKNITFRIMDNLHMDVPKEYFDVVVARNTPSCPKQIYECLKPGGYLIIHGVDKYDCFNLKKLYGKGQAYDDTTPISIIDYSAVIDAGFKDAELVPLHEREYFKNEDLLYKFMLKVPILDEFSEEEGEVKDYYLNELDKEKLHEYVLKNTCEKGIRLIRRYYGITARK